MTATYNQLAQLGEQSASAGVNLLNATGCGFDKNAFQDALYVSFMKELAAAGVNADTVDARMLLLSPNASDSVITQLSGNGSDFKKMKDYVKLSSSTNGTVNVQTIFTNAFMGLQKQITPALNVKLGIAEYFPEMMQYSQQIMWSMINPYTGQIPEYTPGSNPVARKLVGNKQIAYQAPFYREEKCFTETDLLFWRNLSEGDLAVRGAMQQISINMEDAMTRMVNRQYNLIVQGIYNNYFEYQGEQILFGIPSGNRLTPVNGAWANRANTSSPWVYNNGANPMYDLIQWINNNPLFVKYRPFLKTIHMNPRTWGAFVQNPNVRSFIQYSMANPTILNSDSKSYSGGAYIKAFIPGLENVSIIVEESSWIDDSDVTLDANRYYQNSTAQWFIPDGYIFFGIDTMAFGGPLGQFQMVSALQNGGLDNPQPGRFLMMDDNIAPGTRGGPANPFLGMVYGFNGGLAVVRPNDVLSAQVFTTGS